METGIAGLYKLNDQTSSYSAEAIAIERALDYVLTQSFKSLNICSDSRNCLLAIQNSVAGLSKRNGLNHWVNEIMEKIIVLQDKGINVRFSWCPSHIGILGNEKADKLAKTASRTGLPLNNKISLSEISITQRLQYRELDDRFRECFKLSTGEYYINRFNNLKITQVKNLMKGEKRANLVLVSRLVTRYMCIKERLFRMKMVESPVCMCGEHPQDINHIFWACPLTKDIRMNFIKILK
ncbi:hypothetical protein ALC62_06108 [Cyphomyrmex costatus]|uniref:RNase H type-1 domain-containing protein n=1 Tax=Cyphomyrmex costatus TaxID=456900 RepID=A0A195CSC7_9HYME|nr:hypothetical protein ALC62_06108 [Cyphomyrmex costatus]